MFYWKIRSKYLPCLRNFKPKNFEFVKQACRIPNYTGLINNRALLKGLAPHSLLYQVPLLCLTLFPTAKTLISTYIKALTNSILKSLHHAGSMCFQTGSRENCPQSTTTAADCEAVNCCYDYQRNSCYKGKSIDNLWCLPQDFLLVFLLPKTVCLHVTHDMLNIRNVTTTWFVFSVGIATIQHCLIFVTDFVSSLKY